MSGFPLNALNLFYGAAGGFIPPGGCAPAPVCAPCTTDSSCPPAGNGLGTFFAGQNPFPAIALTSLQPYRAVSIGVGGLNYASNDNPADEFNAIGIIGAGIAGGAQGSVLWGGPATNPINGSGGWNWALGTPVYLGTNGNLTQTPPAAANGFTRVVGLVLSSNTILVLSQVPRQRQVVPINATVLDAPTLTIDGKDEDVANIVLTVNTTITLVGPFEGHKLKLNVVQGGSGSYTLTFVGAWFGALALTQPSTAVGDRSSYWFEYDAATSKYVLRSQAIHFNQ